MKSSELTRPYWDSSLRRMVYPAASASRAAGGRRAKSAGERLEKRIVDSAGEWIEIQHLPPTGGRYIGPRQFVGEPICCDFLATVRQGPRRGAMVVFDAKSNANHRTFPLTESIVKPHQRDFLVRMGRAGALAGLLLEASHSDVGLYFWCPWRVLAAGERSIAWEDERLVEMGALDGGIQWGQLLGMGKDGE